MLRGSSRALTSDLAESYAVDDVFECIAVTVELVLWSDADEVVHHSIGRQRRHDPIRLAPARRRLIRSFCHVSLATGNPDAVMTACNSHVKVRSLKLVKQLVRRVLQRDASLAVVVRFECRDHHSVSEPLIENPAVGRKCHCASLPVLTPVVRIPKLNVLTLVIGRPP